MLVFFNKRINIFNELCRIAAINRVAGDISSDDTSRSDNYIATNIYSWHDNRTIANKNIITDHYRFSKATSSSR